MMITTKVLFFCIIIGRTYGGWKDVLKNVKEKAKQRFENEYGSKGTKNFLGKDLSEYPGTKQYFRDLNKKKWDAYYECLTTQDKNLGQHQSVTPIALAALEGTSVKLECGICLSPDNMNDLNSVVWYSAMKDEVKLESIELDEHTLISPTDKTLMMYNLRLDQSGQYMCSLGQSLTAPYFLTIFKSFEANINRVHPKRAPHGPYPTEDVNLPQYSIRLSTDWGTWSTCSECGKIGKKHKYGVCTVLYSFEGNTRIRRGSTQIPNQHLELLKIFEGGIPCSSHILPKEIKDISDVRNRKDEMMIGFCKENCKEEIVFEVTDEHGNIVEEANNSAGIYSMEQGMPPAEPQIEKALEYRKADSDISLSCPGNLNSEAPIQWQIGHRTIVPELISKETDGRIFVGLTDRIHIKMAQVSDSNIYSCWQHKELAGMIKLVVEKKLEFKFNHHIMMFAMVLILFTFFWVFTKAFFGRKYARIRD